jgi:hypothetical protein
MSDDTNQTPPSAAEVEAAARAMCDEIGVPQEGEIFDPRSGQFLTSWKHQQPKAIAALRAAAKVRAKRARR